MPRSKKPDPQPPSPEEAARIVDAAWEDPDWGHEQYSTGQAIAALAWQH